MSPKLMTLTCLANQDHLVIGIKHTVEANELKLKNRQETEWYQKKRNKKKKQERPSSVHNPRVYNRRETPSVREPEKNKTRKRKPYVNPS